MISFTSLPDNHPTLHTSPLLRAAHLTLTYTQEHGSIGLTTTRAFKRSFVHWAVREFDWPGFGETEAFRFKKTLNEHEFTPLQMVHFLLLQTRMARHYKGTFRLTAKGKSLATSPGQLFAELIPFYILEVDHASYGRLGERPFGKWDVWLNVLNVEMEDGATEKKLYGVFYGEGPDWDNEGWREMAAFVKCVLKPLEWVGLVVTQDVEDGRRSDRMCFKTSLWRAVLRLDTDGMVMPAVRH